MPIVVDQLEQNVIDALPGTDEENAEYLRHLASRLQSQAEALDPSPRVTLDFDEIVATVCAITGADPILGRAGYRPDGSGGVTEFHVALPDGRVILVGEKDGPWEVRDDDTVVLDSFVVQVTLGGWAVSLEGKVHDLHVEDIPPNLEALRDALLSIVGPSPLYGSCDSDGNAHRGPHTFRNDPYPCVGWNPFPLKEDA